MVRRNTDHLSTSLQLERPGGRPRHWIIDEVGEMEALLWLSPSSHLAFTPSLKTVHAALRLRGFTHSYLRLQISTLKDVHPFFKRVLLLLHKHSFTNPIAHVKLCICVRNLPQLALWAVNLWDEMDFPLLLPKGAGLWGSTRCRLLGRRKKEKLAKPLKLLRWTGGHQIFQ